MAADDRDATVVAALLNHGADPRIAGEYGDTPLTRAVSGGALTDIDRPLLGGCRPATVRALLAHDPTLRLPDNFAGRQALRFARFHECGEVLELVGRGDPRALVRRVAVSGTYVSFASTRRPTPPDDRPRTRATADRRRR